jgi:hypothetical protein
MTCAVDGVEMCCSMCSVHSILILFEKYFWSNWLLQIWSCVLAVLLLWIMLDWIIISQYFCIIIFYFVLQMAPHSLDAICSEKWDRPYSREIAAYPLVCWFVPNANQNDWSWYAFGHLQNHELTWAASSFRCIFGEIVFLYLVTGRGVFTEYYISSRIASQFLY